MEQEEGGRDRQKNKTKKETRDLCTFLFFPLMKVGMVVTRN